MNNIAILASGSGSNAENIITYFNNHSSINVQLLGANKADAFALTRAERLGVPSFIFSKEKFNSPELFLKTLDEYNINTIVLAGFLWLVPQYLIKAFPNRIINIHPALLPAYGGKGMYGMNVHKAVVENRDPQSGITIHLVNTEYDKGNIIFQACCDVLPTDTPEQVAEKVHELEYKYFPVVIERWLM